MAVALQVSAEESGGSLGGGLSNRAQAPDSSIQQAARLLKQAQRCAPLRPCCSHPRAHTKKTAGNAQKLVMSCLAVSLYQPFSSLLMPKERPGGL